MTKIYTKDNSRDSTEIIADLYKQYRNHIDFYEKGLFSSEIKLNFEVHPKQPWIFFECLDDKIFSFAAHELELGNREGNIESFYLHNLQNTLEFNGFVNNFYKYGIGHLRGILENKKDYHKIGVWIKNHEPVRLLNNEQINNLLIESPFLDLLYNLVQLKNTINSKPSKID